MKTKPVAWMYAVNGIWTAFSDELPPDDAYDEGTLTPLYTHQYERPHNTVLVPCDKLAEMQAEIETLKQHLNAYQVAYNPAKHGVENE